MTHRHRNTDGRMVKDPDAVLDFRWDWTDWLDDDTAETITSANIIGAVGVTVDDSNVDGATVVARVSGGAIGEPASATCRITTSTAQVDDRTMTFTIRER